MYLFILFLFCMFILIPTAYAGLIGAPYAPTKREVAQKAFKALKISEKDVVIDLGSGDGKILRLAAAHGAKAIGYELSPLFWAISKISSFRNKDIRVRFANFYKQTLSEATVIFIFLMPDKMPRIKEMLKKQHIPHARYLLSYIFHLDDVDPLIVIRKKRCGPIYVYDLKELTAKNKKDL